MGFFTWGILRTALETGLIYSLVALSLFISYSILNICDLSTDGCYTLGCAVGAVVTLAGHPFLAPFAAMGAGILSGLVSAVLQTRFGVQSILAGIIVNTALYTINLGVMGFRSNLAIVGKETIFTVARGISPDKGWKDTAALVVLVLVVALIACALYFFLGTRLGLSLRATGDSPAMVRASSINPAFTTTVALGIGGALTGLAGALIGQYNKTSDINLGTGMVTIALASLIIGESLFRTRHMAVRILGAIAGSVLYRLIIAVALRLHVPTEAFKLVSAVIVAIAIVLPQLRTQLAQRRQRRAAMQAHSESRSAEGGAR